MIARIKLVPTSDGSDLTTGSVQEISVVVKGNPIKKVKVGNTEVKSNYNIENGLVRLYNTFEYGVSDLTNQYVNVEYNSYVYSFDINEKFNVNNLRLVKFHPYGSLSNGNIRLYPWYDIPNETYYPNAGEWPSPVFLKTAQIVKNGNTLTIGTKGSIVNLYNNSNYSGDPVYSTSVDGNITAIYNLKPKATYYYRVLDSNSNILFSGNFTTEGQIRFIRLPQVHNVRDCGGWKTTDEQNRFRYGVLFRGAQFNKYFSNPNESTWTKAANELVKLGVNKRIDITGSDEVKSISNITRITIQNLSSLDYHTVYNNFLICIQVIKEIITNTNNGNATYLHCQQGRDRTGSLVAIIQALCGISEDGIIKNYELTTAWGNLTTRNQLRTLWTGFINNYSDSVEYPTIQSKVQQWFIDNYNAMFKDTQTATANSTYQIANKTTGEEALNFIRTTLLEAISSSDDQNPQPQEDDVYITQINDDSFTGSPIINGDIFTWPLKVTLSDGTVTTYANYRSNHSNYGDATNVSDNPNASNEGYIDVNGNLTYDLSKTNYVLDTTYLGTVTLPCITDSSKNVTKAFDLISKRDSTFQSYIDSKYNYTTISEWNLSYHLSTDCDQQRGVVVVTYYPTKTEEGYSLSDLQTAVEISTDCLIKITHANNASESINFVGVVNTDTALTVNTYHEYGYVLNSNEGEIQAYTRGVTYSQPHNAKFLTTVKGQTAYIRNTTDKAHSYLILFGRWTNYTIQIGTPKTSS